MIAFLGTGLLGSGFVRALRGRGEAVNVWNRTAEKAKALEAHGAKAFEDPAEAVRGAARVHLALSDDAAVDEVLERARPGLGKDAVLVDHTTTSPKGAAARAARWRYQHAPVFMSPANALESKGVMMCSGDKALFDALSPELSKMTGKLVHLGPSPERAAGLKLLGNLFLMFMTDGLAEALNLAKALDIPREDAARLFDFFNPGPTIPSRLKRMLSGDYSRPSWELGMARKDARLMMEAAPALPVLPSIARELDRWIERGHAKEDWTVIAKDAI
ncbi:MAG TPA: NAD(P)-dependent oxidoreductase [Myxococcaceae bacterium]|nr:NAD(P)-dependent oxidoreductase [Myxococcaceae bacterium]